MRVAALATFTSDGSVIETNATEVVPMMVERTAVYGTPGHGIWQPGPAISNFFIQFISLLLNQNETLHAKKIVTITGSLDLRATTSEAVTVMNWLILRMLSL